MIKIIYFFNFFDGFKWKIITSIFEIKFIIISFSIKKNFCKNVNNF